MNLNINQNYLQQNSALTSNLTQSEAPQNHSLNENNNKQIYNFDSINITQSFASEFGFRTDFNGFFEKDLNKIANIPQNYDINVKSVRIIAKELAKNNESKNYNNIDLPNLLNSYHNALSAVNPVFNDKFTSNFSQNEISKMAQGFSSKNELINGEITKIYDKKLLDFAKEIRQDLNMLNLDNKIIDFAFNKTATNTATNEFLKPYLAKDGSISKAGLLMNFALENTQENARVQFFTKPVKLALNSQENFYKIINNELDSMEFLKQENTQKMSFDLYLHINGVDKKALSDDKLDIYFQQYLSYEKNLDLKEFANSSSIFNDYINKTNDFLQDIKAKFNTNKIDIEELDKINENYKFSMNDFNMRREKQAKFNKIVNSYLAIAR